jgi:hypothetical protein
MIGLVLAFLLGSLIVGSAQEDARAIWQVQRYDLDVNALSGDRDLGVRAVITVKNVGRAAGTTVTLRIAKAAVVTAAKVSDAGTDFRSAEETRGNLQRITVTIPSFAPNSTVQIALDYRIPVASNSGIAALSPIGSQFLPVSQWYPTTGNPFTNRGADTAPFKLTVNAPAGLSPVSSGKAAGSSVTQAFDAQPFFVTGTWDVIEGSGDASGISAFAPKGATAAERKQAEGLIATAAAARGFFVGLLGPAPDLPIRLIAVNRGGGFSDGGALLLDAAAFRRAKVDSNSAGLIAECVVRTWLGAATPVRGDGAGVIREGLVHYLASLFIEKQFGRDAVDGLRQRERLAYVAVVKRDAPLTLTTPLEDTYFNTVTNKGAMMWRLVDRSLGRDSFVGVLRATAQSGRESGSGLTLVALRQAVAERGGAGLKTLIDQELDQPTDLDLLIGLPQQRGAEWVSQLRNLGSFEVNTTVAATTVTGEKLTGSATIPARAFGEVVFKTANRITRVEVDPEKIYPQLDYSNDAVPRGRLTDAALADAKAAYDRGDYAKAESIARDVLAVYPWDEDARLRLARSLLGGNKLGDAEKEFTAILNGSFPSAIALSWANAEMGELRLRQNQNAAAAKFFDEAVRAGGDYGATVAARAGRIKAEAGSPPPIDEAAKAFFVNFDRTLVNGRRPEIEALIVPGELARFVSGVTINQPQSWQTRVIRTESLDANRLAVDVGLAVRQLDKDATGTAVMILARVGGAWKLEDVQFFEVH